MKIKPQGARREIILNQGVQQLERRLLGNACGMCKEKTKDSLFNGLHNIINFTNQLIFINCTGWLDTHADLPTTHNHLHNDACFTLPFKNSHLWNSSL